MERRVPAAFLYHSGLPYRRIESFVDRSYEAIRQWFHWLKYFFEPDCWARKEVAVDDTKIEIDGEQHYVWAAVDCETLEVLAIEVSPDRSSLDVLLFLKNVLERCRGRLLVRTNCGSWYDWPLKLVDYGYEREMWGNRSLIGAQFGIFKFRASTTDFTSTAPPAPPDLGLQPSPRSIMLRSNLDTLSKAIYYFIVMGTYE